MLAVLALCLPLFLLIGLGHALGRWLGWLGAQWAARQGWLDASSATALVLACALPSAANVALLAQRVGGDDPAVSRTILQTTACAVLTLPCLAWLLGVRL